MQHSDHSSSSTPSWATSSPTLLPHSSSSPPESSSSLDLSEGLGKLRLMNNTEDSDAVEETWELPNDYGSRTNFFSPSGGSLPPAPSLEVVEDFTFEFFRPLLLQDSQERARALEAILKSLRESLKGDLLLVKAHLARIVRFSAEVPFRDVANGFSALVDEIEASRAVLIDRKIPHPSAFIPKRYFVPVADAGHLAPLFEELFLQSGRVSHLDRILALHPSYLAHHSQSLTFILKEGGTLPLAWRHYLAILTGARHKCEWLVYVQEEEFLLAGGDPKWLEGYSHAPRKLQNLLGVIALLAHQPWRLSKEHIDHLVKTPSQDESWTVAELVHAFLIVCTINAMVGIVYACGVTLEIDASNPSAQQREEEPEDEEDKEVSLLADTHKITALLRERGGWEQDSEEQPVALFLKAESLSALDYQHSQTEGDPLSRFVVDWEVQHEDFDVKSRSYSIFRAQDYGWKADGFELVRRFLPGASSLLDEQFDHIYSMTYHRFNESTDVDTLPFRRAVWQYVQRVKGVFHDDYDYGQVNLFLNRSTKQFIKKVVSIPETVTQTDFREMGYALQPDEKVHVALLAVESAKQATLLYGLNSVMHHFYNR